MSGRGSKLSLALSNICKYQRSLYFLRVNLAFIIFILAGFFKNIIKMKMAQRKPKRFVFDLMFRMLLFRTLYDHYLTLQEA